MFNAIGKAFRGFWKALTPDGIKCAACGRDLTQDELGGLCEKCVLSLAFTGNHVCEKCGVKIGGESRFCERCPSNRHNFEQARSTCEFEWLSRHLVHRLKFGSERYLAKHMAYFMSEVFKNTDWEIDAVTFVPMTEAAEKRRGYNQAHLLAKEFCDIMQLPLERNVKKVRETSNQATLNYKERMENIKSSYEIIDKSVFRNKTVLVVDDVKTTGATLDEVARVLMKSGADRVYGLTFASRTQKADLGAEDAQ